MTQKKTIEQRLASLPAKLNSPFGQLLAKKLIAEETLHIILDAGELTKDTSKLLGFAIAYLYMDSQNIPVGDAIQMAKNQRRKINLDWSAKRWKAEHDRFSRLEALDKLTQEDAKYDLRIYEQFLPKKFSGYLIRNSRRLGMEGLRQRHCVASYHAQIKSGRCAIVTMLVNKQRWTTELLLTKDKESPLRIGQVKTLLNGSPTKDIRDRIYQQLGLSPDAHRHPTAESNHRYMDTLRRLLPMLQEQGIEEITVRFEGFGDSGSIEDIEYSPDEREKIQSHSFQYQKAASTFDGRGWINEFQMVTGTVNEAIEDLTYDYLEETGVDWYNNDGGYGKLVINVLNETVSLDVDVRYTDNSNEHSSERNILTGEELQ